MTPAARARGLAAVVVAAGALLGARSFARPGMPAPPPALAPPRPRAAGGLWWGAATEQVPADLMPWLGALGGPLATDSSRAAAWHALSRRPHWRMYALRRLAALQMARGDSAAADSSLAPVAETRGVWQWPALGDRARLALARRDTAEALRRLEGAVRSDWTGDERAQWLGFVAPLHAATGDLAGAIALGRQAIMLYPSLPAAAAMLPRWEGWMKASDQRPNVPDLRAAAEVEFYRPDRAAAARRLEEALKQVHGAASAEIGLRLGEVLRAAHRFGDADRALGRAEREADRGLRARIDLERARGARDAGHVDRAGTWYGKAAELATEPPVRELAYWERARDLEQRGAWTKARADYAQVAVLGLGRSQDAALRTGLLWLVEGQADSARAAWARGGGEAAEFWSAISWRHSERERADSLLGVVARRAGYSFYRTAARDTLGRVGWPAEVAPAAAPDSGDETLALARDLIAAGEGPDAAALLQRWAAGDPRLPTNSRTAPRGPAALLLASRLAYAAGKPALGIQIARRAIEAAPESSTAERWALVPWAYPPAYDSLVSARADTGAHAVIDRALLFALIWQESKFDAAARSRSNAIGLMQLKPSVANAMARLRREYPPPGEAGLMDPAVNLKYGTRLLDQLRMSFDGQLTLMLAAYNAGPASAARWRRPETVGGEALEAELFEYAETQDYVKSILGARQAYRELAPHAARPPR